MSTRRRDLAVRSLWGCVLGLACALSAVQGRGVLNQAQGQSTAPKTPYVQQDVDYENPNANGVTLAGTFCKPPGGRISPAVLLISGAGPQDRDETIAGHKPFAVLSDFLVRHGFAVLRSDDRGTAKSTGDFAASTTKDFASDAEAGVRFLLARNDVDRKHVGLIGHGEGAIVAVMLAARMPEISFIVLLDGTATPGEQVLLTQTARAETAAGISEEQIEADYKVGRGLYSMVRAGQSEAAMQEALTSVPEEYEQYAVPWRKQIPKLQTSWLRFFLSYDPAAALREVKCPVLAIWGAKDMQVDPRANEEAMKAALSKAHNRDVTTKILPDLNYMLQKADSGLAYEYGEIKETISPTALNLISSWLEKSAI